LLSRDDHENTFGNHSGFSAREFPRPGAGSAAGFPSKSIRIYGQGTGSTADYLSRYVGQKLTERWAAGDRRQRRRRGRHDPDQRGREVPA